MYWEKQTFSRIFLKREEFTKVKNIAKEELGRYEIDIWYFSPFSPEYRDS